MKPAAAFDAAADGDQLRAAMRGLGTDEEAIVELLTQRSNAQRQQIAAYFRDALGRDCIDDLKSELGGDFECVIVALMTEPARFLCEQLNAAMVGCGTDERVLIQVLCTMDNAAMGRLVSTYEELYARPLAEHMCSETDGHFRRLLTLIVTGVRDETGTVDAALAAEQAAQLWSAGEAKLGTDEEVFNRILSHGSFEHLRLVFDEYRALSGQTIEQAIEHEVDGELQEAFLAIGECSGVLANRGGMFTVINRTHLWLQWSASSRRRPSLRTVCTGQWTVPAPTMRR